MMPAETMEMKPDEGQGAPHYRIRSWEEMLQAVGKANLY